MSKDDTNEKTAEHFTLYDVFEVSETASNEVIRAAYIALSKKYHPDVCKGNPKRAAEIMKMLNASYEILSDPEKRKQYDLSLSAQRRKTYTNTNSQTHSEPADKYPDPSNHINQSVRKHISYSRFSQKKVTKKDILVNLVVGIMILITIVPIIKSAVTHPGYAYSPSQSAQSQENSPSPVSEPQSGTVLSGKESSYASEMTVTASSGSSCVVKLKAPNGNTRLTFYVRSGDSVTVGVPREELYVYFASGKTWYGNGLLFGEDTYYSMDKTLCDFSQYTYEYTLQPITSGNFQETPINAEDFK